MGPSSHDDHQCEWRDEALGLECVVVRMLTRLREAESVAAKALSDEHARESRDDALGFRCVVVQLLRQLDAQRKLVAEKERILVERDKRMSEQEAKLASQALKLEELDAAKAEIEELSAKLAAVTAKMDTMRRKVFGPKSEKMPPVDKELRREETEEDKEARRLRAIEKRKAHQALKERLKKWTVTHHVSDEDKACPHCGGTACALLGEGKRTTMFEYIPGYFIRQEHVQEKLACSCGQYIATAEPPPKPFEKGIYGAGFVAHVVTMKCADSIPLNRLARQYQRVGISMARSTLTDLFHAAAVKLTPLYQRLLQLIASSWVVQADETPLVMQRPNRRGYIWTFLCDNLIAYRFSGSRSGLTPLEVLGGTKGTLVVDAYTGYNPVTTPEGRERSGCLAHVRRGFFDALRSARVEAQKALDLILDVYRVEHEAKARGIVRTAAHLALRQSRSKQAMDAFHTWLVDERPKHPPKGPLGEAIKYALNQWHAITKFLDDVRIPIDNNRSEGALRVVALGRKNFLFVGDEDLGENLAGLYSLVATCEANSIDPVAYLKDVLLRVDTHPSAQIDELLPHKWSPPITWTEEEEVA